MSTIFQKIIDKQIPADIVFEDDVCLAFKDISPKKQVHLLMIPKKPIASMADLGQEDQQVMGHMMLKITEVAASAGLEKGYRVITNIGQHGGQEVPHLHFHILGGEPVGPLTNS